MSNRFTSYCLAFGAVACVTSALGQGQPPRITNQPISQIVVAGANVTFTVGVAISGTPLSFQWYVGSLPLSGATNASLVLTNVTPGRGNDYTVVVANAAAPVTSDVAGLTVVQDASISASLGGNATLWVKSGGPAPLSYQWRLNEVDIPGLTTDKYVLTNAQPADVGQYSVVVTNLAGTVILLCPALLVDPTFTKITSGPVIEPQGESWGCAWGDYDNDGYIDLFVANGAIYGTQQVNCLYRNNRDGTFTKMTTNDVGSIVGEKGGWREVAWGDYDNDGFLDVKVSENDGPGALYRNVGDGTFLRVTNAGPVVTNRPDWGAPCWGDYDNDGWLDLFSAKSWQGIRNDLYHNQGDGTFTAATGPLVTDVWDTEGSAWGDMDGDGDLDMVLAGDNGIRVYRNDGDGVFVRLTQGPLAQEKRLAVTPSWADYDNDGKLDLFIPMYNSTSDLFHNEGNGEFTKIIMGEAGHEAGMGMWGDYDNDGYLDLFVARGQNGDYANLLFRNNGDGTFTQVKTGSLANDVGRSATCAWGDYDNDGFLDLFVARRAGEQKLLYHNNGNSNRWLLVKLVGTTSNRAAIGAKVRATATINGRSMTQMREISGGNRAQNDLRAHFGLGDATNVDLVRIEWPSGIVQELTNLTPKQFLTVTEAGAGIRPRWQELVVGSNLTFHASTTLTSPVTYQWQRYGTNLVGETNVTLTLPNAQVADAGEYTVTVSTADGTQSLTSAPVLLKWSGEPIVRVQPQSQIVAVGSDVTFSVDVLPSTVAPTFQWQGPFGDIVGATNATLTLTNVALYRGGDYTVTVSNPAGSVTSDAAGLTVVQDQSVSVSLGADLTLKVGVAGPPAMSVQWRFNAADIAPATNLTYSVNQVGLANVGQYSVVVTNLAGAVTVLCPPLLVDPTFTKITTGVVVADPPVMTAGLYAACGWADYDGDGYLDLLVGVGSPSRSTVGGRNFLYHNNRDGTFTKITDGPIVNANDVFLGWAWGDYDNDGHLDLLANTALYKATVYRNQGDGTFVPLLPAFALGGGGQGGNWVDYDQDGWLDVFLSDLYPPGKAPPNYLFRNTGADTFSRITNGIIVTETANTSLTAWADYDNDGRPDLVAPHYDSPTALYHNEGEGVFTKVKTGPIVQDTILSGTPCWVDYDNDGNLDLFIKPHWDARSLLYHNNGDGTFVRLANVITFDPSESAAVFPSWGDYDNDGYIDLFVTGSRGNYLYRNNGDGTFTRITTGSPANDRALDSAAAWGDFDNDGFLDLMVAVGSQPSRKNFLYRNNGNSNTWLEIDLVGKVSNRSGIGAQVRALATIGGKTFRQMRLISGDSPSTSGGSLRAHFGFGDATNVDTLRIEWPSGIVQELPNVPTKQFRTVTEEGVGILPRKQLALAGSDYTFRAATTLAGPVTYQWRYGTDNLTGETNATLTVPSVQKTNTGEYSVVASNGTDSMTSESVVLYWPEPPLITQQPESQIVVAGADVKFTVGVVPNPVPPTFQWQQNTVDLAGATNATLLLTNVSYGQGSDYTVVVSNPAGSATSDVAGLTVVQDKSISASLGGNVTLRIRYNGPPPATYQWQLNGKDIAGATNATLSITNAQLADVGDYSVVVANAAGSVTSHAPALVVDPTFTMITTGAPVTDLGSSWGGSVADYDGDGYVDLFVARSSHSGSALYHNNQNGTFTSITNLPFAGRALRLGTWADFDNDGRLDLYAVLANSRTAFFYYSNGDGTFTPSQSMVPDPLWLFIAVGDYNGDGLLDVHVGSLYRNNGDRTFTQMTAREVGAIASIPVVNSGWACWADYDNDGLPELCFLDSGSSKTVLYHNDGTGRFFSVTNLVTKAREPAYAPAWGDYDNDGLLDLCVGGGCCASSSLYHNLGNGQFEKATIGLTLGTCNSATWVDYDNDGFLDLFFTRPSALYHNNGDGTFTRVRTGSLVNDVALGGAWSLAGLWFDYDNDGFLDLYVCNGVDNLTAATAGFLYHNNGNGNAWLTVRLIGTVSNRDGLGAKVRVQAKYAGQVRWQLREVSAGDAVSSQNGLIAHFGLGDATNVDTVRIEWPSGIVQELHDVAPRHFLTVTEPPGLAMSRPGELRVTAWSNMTHSIEASTNLVQWTSLGTVTNQARTAVFTDPAAASLRYRFYRAVKP